MRAANRSLSDQNAKLSVEVAIGADKVQSLLAELRSVKALAHDQRWAPPTAPDPPAAARATLAAAVPACSERPRSNGGDDDDRHDDDRVRQLQSLVQSLLNVREGQASDAAMRSAPSRVSVDIAHRRPQPPPASVARGGTTSAHLRKQRPKSAPATTATKATYGASQRTAAAAATSRSASHSATNQLRKAKARIRAPFTVSGTHRSFSLPLAVQELRRIGTAVGPAAPGQYERGRAAPRLTKARSLANAVDDFSANLEAEVAQLQRRYGEAFARLNRASTPAKRAAIEAEIGATLALIQDRLDHIRSVHEQRARDAAQRCQASIDAQVDSHRLMNRIREELSRTPSPTRQGGHLSRQ